MNTFGGGGFNQNKPGGFNQPAAAGGFGQMSAPQQSGFGQPQQQQTGGFGQQAGGFGQRPGGFNQPQPQQQQQQGGMFAQQPAAATGFGQPAAGVGGFGQPAAGGGFGQQPGTAGTGFGQPAGNAGFGQQPGARPGFGQPATGTGGFGQQPGPQQTGGFGQQQQPQQPNAFGQPQQQTNAFGQPQQQQQQANAFGQTQQPGQQQAGGFGQQPGMFGQPQQQQAGGFGQPQQGVGFSQAAGGGFGGAGRGATGGFGQQPGGFGQQRSQQQQQQQQPGVSGFGPQLGGFGAAGSGGFGAAQQPAPGGFGQQSTTTGFGQQPSAGGFNSAGRGAATGFGAPAGGGFGAAQQPAGSGFGQSTGGFGVGAQSATGGFGVAGRGATTGFGAPAGGGFGTAQQSTGGGFGQQPAIGGFGAAGRGATSGFGAPAGGGFGAAQQPTTGGFGQATGGFGVGAQPTAGGFGQPTNNTGFGVAQQPGAGGFGQPAAGTGFGGQPGATGMGFGQAPAASTGFGAQPGLGMAGGFGQQPTAGTGGFGQQAAPAGGFGQAPAAPVAGAPGGLSSLNFGRPNDLSFMALPDYNASPYGNVLLFDTYERPVPAKQASQSPNSDVHSLAPSTRRAIHTWLVGQMRVPEENTLMNQGPASLGSSALSPFALKEMLVPAVQLGSASATASAPPPTAHLTAAAALPPSRPASAPADGAAGNAAAPHCSNPDFVLSPSLDELVTYTPEELRRVTPFTVRLRDGSGEVRFLDPVNLVRVDVGAALHLSRDGLAELYPNGATAPPLSNGLNVRAEVRVRDETGERREVLQRHCKEVHGSFVGYRHGWCVYRLNDTGRDAAEAAKSPAPAAETSGLHPLTIVRDDDDVRSRNLDDTHLDDDDGDADGELSDRDIDSASVSGSSSEDDAARTAVVDAAVPPSAVVRQFTAPAAAAINSGASRHAAVAERRLAAAAAAGGEFELPYELPDMTATSKVAPFAVKLGAARPSVEPRVLYVRAQASAIQRTYVDHPGGLQGSERTVRGMLARSSRASWSSTGTIAFAAHAELRDGADTDGGVAEVVGDRAVVATPFHWQKPADTALTQCTVALLRLFLQYTDVAAGEAASACPPACVHLHRDRSRNTLSAEKLTVAQRTVQDVAAARAATLTRVEALSLRQTVAVVSLLSALYALPEADDALPNAMEEARYLRQLRHRNLADWLKRELATFLDATKTVSLSPAEELVQIMLCHKLREARTSARSIANDDLARVVRVCGEGNQFGGYVEMAKGGFRNGEEVRQRVVGLLSGRVEPFITDDEYTGVRDGAAEVRAVPSAATWKQLLGIFTFYGCVPDTPAEDIVQTFLDRLRAPSSRKLNPLPPYAERLDSQTLRTKRGKDLVQRGNTFQDAALLLLEGFAAGSAPPASCLHPHASSYAGTDYLTAFLIVVAIRAIQLPRKQTYRDAEVSVLLGLTAALECNDETWFWGLLPLHLIESAADRVDAVRSFCKRNAVRAAALKSQSNPTTDFDRLRTLLRVNAAWLEPVVAPAEEMRTVPENSPSVATHAALEKALAKLAL